MNYIISLMPSMIDGLFNTLLIFIITLLVALPLGLFIGIIRSYKNNILNRILKIYIWIMRGTPLMLQIVFIFFGLPVLGIRLDRFPAVLIAFILNYGAYFGEIFRGGIESVNTGQYEGAKVLGLNKFETYRQIVIPQVIKIVLPSLTNEIITLVKDTSLVYIVGIGELLRAGKIASNRDVSLIPLALVGAIYLFLTGIFSNFLSFIERRFAYYE